MLVVVLPAGNYFEIITGLTHVKARPQVNALSVIYEGFGPFSFSKNFALHLIFDRDKLYSHEYK